MKRCPVCNELPRAVKGFDFLVCRGCAELLYVSELVDEATDETRNEYQLQNPKEY